MKRSVQPVADTMDLERRHTAAMVLIDMWHRIRTADECAQLLDEPIVRYDRWAATFDLGESILAAIPKAIDEWPFPAHATRSIRVETARIEARECFKLALEAFRHFRWSETHGYLFEAGRWLLLAAHTMEVPL